MYNKIIINSCYRNEKSMQTWSGWVIADSKLHKTTSISTYVSKEQDKGGSCTYIELSAKLRVSADPTPSIWA